VLRGTSAVVNVAVDWNGRIGKDDRGGVVFASQLAI
jgi:hypothetical protein